MPYGLVHKITNDRNFTMWIRDELVECVLTRRMKEKMSDTLRQKMVITVDFEEEDSSASEHSDAPVAGPRKVVFIDIYNKPILLATGSSKFHEMVQVEMKGSGIKVFTRLKSKKYAPVICFVTYSGKCYDCKDLDYHDRDTIESVCNRIRRIHLMDMETNSSKTSPCILEETKVPEVQRDNEIINKIVSQTASVKQIKHQIENRLIGLYNSGAGYVEPVINSVNMPIKGLPQSMIDKFAYFGQQIENYDAIVYNAKNDNKQQNIQRPNDYSQEELESIYAESQRTATANGGLIH